MCKFNFFAPVSGPFTVNYFGGYGSIKVDLNSFTMSLKGLVFKQIKDGTVLRFHNLVLVNSLRHFWSMFSEGVKWEHWPKMCYLVRVLSSRLSMYFL